MIKPCPTAVFNPVTQPSLLQLTNENLYRNIFSHFEKLHPSSLKKCYFAVQTVVFQEKLPRHCVSKSYSMVTKLSKLPGLNCKIKLVKTFNLVNLSLISNKTPNLYSVICSEINAVSNTKITKMREVAISSWFLYKLLPLIEKRF